MGHALILWAIFKVYSANISKVDCFAHLYLVLIFQRTVFARMKFAEDCLGYNGTEFELSPVVVTSSDYFCAIFYRLFLCLFALCNLGISKKNSVTKIV